MGLPSKCFIVDAHGEKVGVVLDIHEYRNMLGELEELDAIRAYDAAKASGDATIPFGQAIREIAQGRW